MRASHQQRAVIRPDVKDREAKPILNHCGRLDILARLAVAGELFGGGIKHEVAFQTGQGTVRVAEFFEVAGQLPKHQHTLSAT